MLCKDRNKCFKILDKFTQFGRALTFQLLGVKWRKKEMNIEKFHKDEFRDK